MKMQQKVLNNELFDVVQVNFDLLLNELHFIDGHILQQNHLFYK